MIDWPQVLAMLAPVGACVGGYVAIRADLARVMERATEAKESANLAHNRIDSILMKGKAS